VEWKKPSCLLLGVSRSGRILRENAKGEITDAGLEAT